MSTPKTREAAETPTTANPGASTPSSPSHTRIGFCRRRRRLQRRRARNPCTSQPVAAVRPPWRAASELRCLNLGSARAVPDLGFRIFVCSFFLSSLPSSPSSSSSSVAFSTSSMSTRSFAVFLDTPSHAHDGRDTPSNVPADATCLSTLAAVEKENLHPLTGTRARLAAVAASSAPSVSTASAPLESKKRKTSALATKHLAVPFPDGDTEDAKSSAKRPRKPAVQGRRRKPRVKPEPGQHRVTRRASTSPLPPVQEEVGSQRSPVQQAHIDARCYALTVSPLADVSTAYDAGSRTEVDAKDKEQAKSPVCKPPPRCAFTFSSPTRPVQADAKRCI